jgi:hypothetical protein
MTAVGVAQVTAFCEHGSLAQLLRSLSFSEPPDWCAH